MASIQDPSWHQAGHASSVLKGSKVEDTPCGREQGRREERGYYHPASLPGTHSLANRQYLMIMAGWNGCLHSGITLDMSLSIGRCRPDE